MDQTLKGHLARGSALSQTALATLRIPSLSATSSFISICAASYLVFCLLAFLWSTSDAKPESCEHKLLFRGDLAFIFDSFERVGALFHRRQGPEGALDHLLILQTWSWAPGGGSDLPRSGKSQNETWVNAGDSKTNKETWQYWRQWARFCQKKREENGSDSTESAYNTGDLGSIPWVGKIPWRREWQPTPVFLPGKSHGQRNLAGYSPWGGKRVSD